MRGIVPKKSRYVPMTQQKSCCVPTSISIVMYKRGIPLLPQELLGYHLGLLVKEESKHLFWNPRDGQRPPAGYGTQVASEEYEPDAVFEKLGIPLKMVIYSIDSFETKEKFFEYISDCVENDKDVLTCFCSGVLNGNDKKGGHVCVVDKVFPSRNTIRLIDSSPTQPKWREIEVELLMEAMKKHPSGGGGFWELAGK